MRYMYIAPRQVFTIYVTSTNLDTCRTSLGIASVSVVHNRYGCSNQEGSQSAPAADCTTDQGPRRPLKQWHIRKHVNSATGTPTAAIHIAYSVVHPSASTTPG